MDLRTSWDVQEGLKDLYGVASKAWLIPVGEGMNIWHSWRKLQEKKLKLMGEFLSLSSIMLVWAILKLNLSIVCQIEGKDTILDRKEIKIR